MKSILLVMIFLLVACGHDESKNNNSYSANMKNLSTFANGIPAVDMTDTSKILVVDIISAGSETLISTVSPTISKSTTRTISVTAQVQNTSTAPLTVMIMVYNETTDLVWCGGDSVIKVDEIRNITPVFVIGPALGNQNTYAYIYKAPDNWNKNCQIPDGPLSDGTIAAMKDYIKNNQPLAGGINNFTVIP